MTMTTTKNNELLAIEGAKGKGGGGGASVTEDQNTLSSRQLVRVLEVISEGEIKGLATNNGSSIYFDNTPIMNTDGSFNFSAVKYDWRTGLPSQPHMAGFPSAEAVSSLATVLTTTSPIVVQVSKTDIDAVRIAVQLPQGLAVQDTTTGNRHGSSVQIAIDRRVDAIGVWEQVMTPVITGKSNSPYTVDYRLERPAGTGLWSWRVRRITADSTSSAINNQTAVYSYTEIKDVKLEYNYTAYVGIQVDAESTGNAIPTRAYLVDGIICQIPTNYDPYTRTYTGQWNGTFKRDWTDNPAWVLYDLLTNERYGMGDFVTPSHIDKFSFYNAAVYNDQYVPTGTHVIPAGAVITQPGGAVVSSTGTLLFAANSGATEPRFTFNSVISAQEDALKVLQAVASTQRATLIYSNGVISLNQDRPSDTVKLVSKSNVIDGKFNYVSSPLQQRHTVARVTWNDKSNKYAATIATVEDEDHITTLGYYPTDVVAFGATSEGQAIRAGKWLLDTELTATEAVSYQSSFNQFDLRIGDVIKIFDEDFTATKGAGRVVSATMDSVVLDRPVTITTDAVISVLMNDGKTIAEFDVLETHGTYTTLNIDGIWPLLPVNSGADYQVITTAAARQWRVTEIKLEDANTVAVTAISYDPAKYARIENDVTVAPPIYSAIQNEIILPVTNIRFTPEAFTDPIIGTTLSLRVEWDEPLSPYTIGYDVRWRVNEGQYTSSFEKQAGFTISNAISGVYAVQISAVNIEGKRSIAALSQFTNGFTGANGLAPPLAITLVEGHGTGGNFIGNNLYVEWEANPVNELIPNQTVGGYQVDVYNAVTGVKVRTETTLPADTFYNYTQEMMIRDGGPYRSIRLDVYTLDAVLRPSVNKVTATFTNAAPAVPNNIDATAVINGLMVSYTRPTETDYAGTLIWVSTIDNFTPSESNLVFEGDASVVTLSDYKGGETVYLRIAAYDSFGKSYSGAGLNVSSQFMVTPLTVGIPRVSTLPSTGEEGDIVFLTTDGKLYRYHSGVWTAAVSTTDLTGFIGNDLFVQNSITADKLLANSITAGKLSTAELITTSAQIADGIIMNAHLVNATITNAKIADAAIDSAKIATAAITNAKIADAAIDSAKIQDAAIVSAKILDGAITNAKIANAAITSAKIADATITTAKIADAQISGAKIAFAAIANTHIVDGTITTAKIADAQITAAKIADANITNAKIANAAITSAKIGDLQVDTLKIANGAISQHASGTGTSSLTLWITFSHTAQVTVNVHYAGTIYGDGYTANGSHSEFSVVTRSAGTHSFSFSNPYPAGMFGNTNSIQAAVTGFYK